MPRKNQMSAPMPEKSDTAVVGQRIRQLRRQRGWSLVHLSKATGIPTSTLGKIETNSLAMPVDRLFRLCDALGVPVTEFFDGRSAGSAEAALGRRSVMRGGSGFKTVASNYECAWLFTDLSRKLMFPGLQTVRARTLADFGPLLRHEGEEFALVLRGKVTVITEVYEPTELEPMDGIYIDSRMGHAYLNSGDGEALTLNVSTDARAKELVQGSGNAASQVRTRRRFRKK